MLRLNLVHYLDHFPVQPRIYGQCFLYDVHLYSLILQHLSLSMNVYV